MGRMESTANFTIGRMINFTDSVTPNYAAQPLGARTLFDNPLKSLKPRISETSDSAPKDTLVVLLTLTIISVTLYFSYCLWKRQRHRSLSALSKLEEYRYSRLSQNEIDVDNDRFADALSPQDDCPVEQECDDHELKPATLQLETDSLITISDEHSSANRKQKQNSLPSANGKSNSSLLIDDMSDEDLLQ